jgi:hypothetical protein
MADMHWSDVMQSMPARAPTGTQQGPQRPAKQRLVINAAGLLVPASAAPSVSQAAGADDGERGELYAGGAACDDIKIGDRSQRRARFYGRAR